MSDMETSDMGRADSRAALAAWSKDPGHTSRMTRDQMRDERDMNVRTLEQAALAYERARYGDELVALTNPTKQFGRVLPSDMPDSRLSDGRISLTGYRFQTPGRDAPRERRPELIKGHAPMVDELGRLAGTIINGPGVYPDHCARIREILSLLAIADGRAEVDKWARRNIDRALKALRTSVTRADKSLALAESARSLGGTLAGR